MATPTGASDLQDGDRFDVIVLGAGAAGMAAAVFAGLRGQKVLLVERTQYLGGTSALSAATTWVPLTRWSNEFGTEDTKENVLGFLDRAVGNRAPRENRVAFVENGADAIHTLHDKTDVQFRMRPFHPDYLYELEGSTSNGRALEPIPFDARILGDDLKLVRPPISRIHHPRRDDDRPRRHSAPSEDEVLAEIAGLLAADHREVLRPEAEAWPRHAVPHGECSYRTAVADGEEAGRDDCHRDRSVVAGASGRWSPSADADPQGHKAQRRGG